MPRPREQKSVSAVGFSFPPMFSFSFSFSLFVFFSSHRYRAFLAGRSTRRAPSFVLYGFFFFLCGCYFSGVLNYGTWEKPAESVTVGGLDIVEIMDCME